MNRIPTATPIEPTQPPIVRTVKSVIMKVSVLLTAALLIGSNAFAADTLSTNVTKATVFLSGAQVFRESSNMNIKKGVNEVIIKDVSPNLNPKNIQASALGNFLILDVQYQTEYVPPSAVEPTIVPEKIQKEINWLNDSILFISFEKERISAKLHNLNEEKRMITENQLIKSGGISDTLPEFKEVVTFYREKLDEINELIYVWKKKQHLLAARENKFRIRLNKLQNYARNTGQPSRPAKTRHHILVTTYSDASTYGKIGVNYLVTNAGWIPAYDLRAQNTTDPMTITYKADVYQSTGEDWDKVKLTLSTYNQNVFAQKPTIGIWRLDYTINKPRINPTTGSVEKISVQATQNFYSQEEAESARRDMSNEALKDNKEITFNQQLISIQNMAEINQNFSNVEFNVKLPYTIKADGTHKLMVVTSDKMDADYLHYMLPRVNKNAFLIAKIGDWENLSLLPGEANIYFKQTIVGNTYLDPQILTDTMEVTLGKDEGIISRRKKINEEQKKGILSKNIVKTYTFQIVVKNTSRAAIDLTVEDQIPITKNEDITIKLEDGGGATLDKDSGRLTWDVQMKPGEEKVIEFSYSIEHEKNKPVS